MTPECLITDYFDIWTAAINDANGRGRSGDSGPKLTGIDKLRELILELAARGRLVPQDAREGSAFDLLKRIEGEKSRLYKEGKIKKSNKLSTRAEEEKGIPLPDQWAACRLGDVIEVVRGISFPASEKSSEPQKGRVPCLRTANVQKEIEWQDLLYIRKELVRRRDQFVTKDDIVMSMANSKELVGKTAIVSQDPGSEVTFGAFLGVLRPIQLNPYYITAVLKAPTFRDQLIASASQTTNIANISLGKLKPLVLPIPPVEEQRRIVEKLDELMALCDRVEQQTSDQIRAYEMLVDTLLETLVRSEDATELASNWGRVAAYFDTLFTTATSIDRLEKAVYQVALTGRLVAQEAGDEPAGELLARARAETERLVERGDIRKPKEIPNIEEQEHEYALPDTWEVARLGDLVEIVRGVSFPAAEKSFEPFSGRVPCLRTTNVQDEVEWDDLLYIRRDLVKNGRQFVKEGDILMSMANSRELVGKVALVKERPPAETAIGGFLGVLRATYMEPRYVMIVLRAPRVREYLIGSASQTTNIANISLAKLRPLIVPVPPIDEQKRIADAVDEIGDLCEGMRAALARAGATQRRLAGAVVEAAVK